MRSLIRYFSPTALSAFAFTGLIASNANSAISTNDELHSLLYNGDFTTSAANWINSNGWNAANTMNVVANGSTYCTTITAKVSTAQIYEFAVRQEGLKLEPGHTYTIKGKVWSPTSAPAIRAGLDLTASPYTGFSSILVAPTISSVAPATDNLALTYLHPAASPAISGVHFGFQLGALPANTTVCFDDLVVFDAQFTKPAPRAPKKVVVNQLGYLTNLNKLATYIVPATATNKTTPRNWALKKASVIISSGTTVPAGTTADAASGDFIHNINFSNVTTVGSGYTLEVTEGTAINISHPFKIGADIYSMLKYDALAYFYHNRSGIAVEAAVVGAQFAHPAWHTGDASLSTKSGSRTGINAVNGWYDAGDHGKYVVNGGISVWTMLNQYERAKYLGANSGDFADGTMKLPASERTNNMPDILDEARWEIEWMLRMQIPVGETDAGMVYHKLHDDRWTSLPFNPADPATADPTNLRHIWAPSTAATLNLAAVGAQCYRAYKTVDSVLAKKCLDQAVRAYTAAKNTPFRNAPVTAGSDGGGPYGDTNMQDEYYWAATELYLATLDPTQTLYNPQTYATDMQASSLHLLMPTAGKSSMSWADTAGLGIMSLATAGKSVGANTAWVTSARTAIATRAGDYATSTGISYGTPFTSNATFPVSWGSNADVLNNIIVMGLARDFSCPTGGTPDAILSNAIQNAMSYLVGRNPLDYSYITGYGSDAVKHPHHRFWAFFPLPPAGVVVGGPNGLIDPADVTGSANLAGCVSLKCYMDNIAIYSTNEVTINWNAPLAWSAAYLDEMGSGKKPQTCGGVNAQNGAITVTTGSAGSTDLKVLNNGQAGDVYTLVTPPTKGSVIITNGVATYTGGTSFITTDSFTYTITRAGAVSLPATITVTKQAVTTASCDYKIIQNTHSWNNSWVAQLVIQNTTSSPLSSWSVDLAYPSNTLGSWGNPGSYDANIASISTGNYRLTNKPWNGAIPVGGTLMISINGTSGPIANGSPATPAEVATVSGTTCGSPLAKTVRFHSDHQYSMIYGTDAIVRMGGTNIRYFNSTTTPDNSLIFKVNSTVLPNFIYTQNCCRGAFYPEFMSPAIPLGYNTMTLTTGSTLPQETDTVSFLLTNAKADCSISGTQNGSNWTATVKVTNSGYRPGSIAQYYFEPALPSDIVYKGKNWEAVLAWQEQVYPNSGAIGIARNITSTDGKTRVKEKVEVSGDGSNRYIYYIAPADFIGEIAGRAANTAPASYSFNIAGTGNFFLPGQVPPPVGCDFGKLPSY